MHELCPSVKRHLGDDSAQDMGQDPTAQAHASFFSKCGGALAVLDCFISALRKEYKVGLSSRFCKGVNLFWRGSLAVALEITADLPSDDILDRWIGRCCVELPLIYIAQLPLACE